MIGIIGAMDVEVDLLKSNIQNKKEKKIGNYNFISGILRNKEVVIVKCGVGKVASSVALTLLCEIYNPEFIINTGIAGGNDFLESRDITIPIRFYYSDVDVTAFGYKIGQMPGQPEYFEPNEKCVEKVQKALESLNLEYKRVYAMSADSFITSHEALKYDLTGSTIYEMEGASLAQASLMLNVPFVAIRFISDIIGAPSQIEDYSKFEEDIAKVSNEIILNVIANL